MGRGSQSTRQKRRAALWRRDKQPDGTRICYLCGVVVSKSTFTMDHVVPVDQSGSNDLENLAICCFSCNQEKNTKSFEEYIVGKPSLISEVAARKIKPESFRKLMQMRGIRLLRYRKAS